MIAVISDANIIIDLLHLTLFEDFLRLSWEKHVPPGVVDEVREENSSLLIDAINAGQLSMPAFDFEDLQQIQKYFEQYPPLSVADCSCLHLAERLPAILLTGEKRLRSIASGTHAIKVHGTLWVLDNLIKENIINYRKVHAKLNDLMQINPRLPKAECRKRLKRWKKKIEPSHDTIKPLVRKIRIKAQNQNT